MVCLDMQLQMTQEDQSFWNLLHKYTLASGVWKESSKVVLCLSRKKHILHNRHILTQNLQNVNKAPLGTFIPNNYKLSGTQETTCLSEHMVLFPTWTFISFLLEMFCYHFFSPDTGSDTWALGIDQYWALIWYLHLLHGFFFKFSARLHKTTWMLDLGMFHFSSISAVFFGYWRASMGPTMLFCLQHFEG